MITNDNFFAKIKGLCTDDSISSYTLSVRFMNTHEDIYLAFNGPDSSLVYQLKCLERKIDREAELKDAN